MAGTHAQFAQWSDERRARHSAAIKRARQQGRYRNQAAKLREAHARRRMWPSVAVAGERVDHQLRASSQWANQYVRVEQRHHAILTGPMWELWARGGTASVTTVVDNDIDTALRMHGQYRPTGAVAASWDSVYAHKRAGELAQFVARTSSDVVGAMA
jgi:hypothetical protein